MGLHTPRPFRQFEERVFEHRANLQRLVRALNADGKRVLGYGASTKGNVLLQFCGFTEQEIPAIAEVNPDKFGCFTPGTGIPIVSEAEAKAMRPDYFLVLPWHFKDGILAREAEFLAAGGKMIFPLPGDRDRGRLSCSAAARPRPHLQRKRQRGAALPRDPRPRPRPRRPLRGRQLDGRDRRDPGRASPESCRACTCVHRSGQARSGERARARHPLGLRPRLPPARDHGLRLHPRPPLHPRAPGRGAERARTWWWARATSTRAASTGWNP